MRRFVLFLLMMGAFLCATGIEEARSQEQGKETGDESTGREAKSSSPPAVPEPALPAQDKTSNRSEETTSLTETNAGQPPEGDEAGPGKPDENDKAEIEDLKSRFRKLVEDEMEKFGALEEAVPEEDREQSAGEKKTVATREEETGKAEAEETAPKSQTAGEVVEKGEGEGEEEADEMIREEITEEVVEVTPPEPAQPAEGPQKIGLDFQDADIKEVITALAEIVGINYIIDPKVRRNRKYSHHRGNSG